MTQTIDKLNITREVAALKRMSVKDLRLRYIEVFGEATRSGNKDFLWKRIAWRMQANSEGGLTERARRRAEELANDADVRMRRPPAPPPPSPAATTQTMTVAFGDSAGPPLPGVPGTILTRPYKGRLIQVVVRDDGFEYEGELYGSLSAVAKAVTGSHWSGNLFFKIPGVAGGKRG
jgi:hypothetical protein